MGIPGNVVWRDTKGHRKNNHALTKEWDDFMNKEKPTSKEQIYKKETNLNINILVTNPILRIIKEQHPEIKRLFHMTHVSKYKVWLL
ncbi:MAG: hypothetical protein II900_05825 [Prevotella sp.]|nr:hypothetical protein [Prevotella sp.]